MKKRSIEIPPKGIGEKAKQISKDFLMFIEDIVKDTRIYKGETLNIDIALTEPLIAMRRNGMPEALPEDELQLSIYSKDPMYDIRAMVCIHPQRINVSVYNGGYDYLMCDDADIYGYLKDAYTHSELYKYAFKIFKYACGYPNGHDRKRIKDIKIYKSLSTISNEPHN